MYIDTVTALWWLLVHSQTTGDFVFENRMAQNLREHNDNISQTEAISSRLQNCFLRQNQIPRLARVSVD